MHARNCGFNCVVCVFDYFASSSFFLALSPFYSFALFIFVVVFICTPKGSLPDSTSSSYIRTDTVLDHGSFLVLSLADPVSVFSRLHLGSVYLLRNLDGMGKPSVDWFPGKFGLNFVSVVSFDLGKKKKKKLKS